MTPFLRAAHKAAIAFQAGSLVLYAYAYTLHPASFLVAAAGWSVFFGAYSTRALQKARRPGLRA